MGTFYKWRERDFVSLPAYELQKGDEIAYGFGGDLKYGAIALSDVTVVAGVGILLQFTLPVGALAQSSQTRRIAVFWRGKTPLIQVSEEFSFRDYVLVRRKH